MPSRSLAAFGVWTLLSSSPAIDGVFTACMPALRYATEMNRGVIHFVPTAAQAKDNRLRKRVADVRRWTSLEVREDSGWTWPELELVDESTDGASRAQRDALKLLAVMIQHTDTKAEQQRLLCPKQESVDIGDVCAEPVLMVNDLGLSFGSANLVNRDSIGAVNFDHWSKEPVWADVKHCVGNLIVSQTGITRQAAYQRGRSQVPR
jgi:hypothetical protein